MHASNLKTFESHLQTPLQTFFFPSTRSITSLIPSLKYPDLTAKSLLSVEQFEAENRRYVIEYLYNGALPIDKLGTIALPQLPERHFPKAYMAKHKISDEILMNHFTKLFTQMQTSLCNKDYSSLNSIVEQRFLDKLKSKESVLNDYDLKFVPSDDLGVNESYVVDKMIHKGIKQDRTKNDSNHDYILANEMNT